MKMSQNRNNANGTGVSFQEGNLGPGGRPVANQVGVHRQSMTGSSRREWSRAESIKLMECYYLRSPERRGKVKRLQQIYRERGETQGSSALTLPAVGSVLMLLVAGVRGVVRVLALSDDAARPFC